MTKLALVKLLVSVTPDQKAKIESEAASNSMSQAEYVRYILRDFWAAQERRMEL